MNDQWRQFLDTQAARIDTDERVEFKPADSQHECTLVDLSYLGLISVTGGDAERFLQGQVTNDVRNITDDHFQISALCTPKGRMQASFVAFRHKDACLLQMPRATQQILLKRLPMFILMSDVQIADVSDNWVRIGLQGACAPRLLEAMFPKLPGTPWGAAQAGEITLLRHPGNIPRFELIGPPRQMIETWQGLASSALPAGPENWSLERIRAGIPTVYGETTEAFIPQMTNMQLIEGVSFTKGCYTGQEIVARTKYLGKIKRRMYLAHIDSSEQPQPGEDLFSPVGDSDRGAGKVVDSEAVPGGGYDLLAVVDIARKEQGEIHLGGLDGPVLSFKTLPYPLEKD